MNDFTGSAAPDAADDLAFIPLGGTGEIGMNLNVYRCDGKLLAIDCGIGFGGPEMPEVEVMVPDPVWLSERRDRLVGLVITHAHEDHVGAVAHLWPQLRCPIYAGPFVAAVLRRKLGEAGLNGEAKVITVPLSGSVSLKRVERISDLVAMSCLGRSDCSVVADQAHFDGNLAGRRISVWNN